MTLKQRQVIGAVVTVILVIGTSGCEPGSDRPSGEEKNVQTSQHEKGKGMIIQIIRFESELSEDDIIITAKQRIGKFRTIPGLIQKYYVKLEQPNQYGGIYIWDSMESLTAFRASDLAASIPTAYKIKGTPRVEILNGLFPLRD